MEKTCRLSQRAAKGWYVSIAFGCQRLRNGVGGEGDLVEGKKVNTTKKKKPPQQELKYCEQYEDARTVLLEAKALMLSLGSDVHTDRLQAVQDVLDEIDMDYAAVKKVAGEQVRGTCDGVAVTKDTPQEKRVCRQDLDLLWFPF